MKRLIIILPAVLILATTGCSGLRKCDVHISPGEKETACIIADTFNEKWPDIFSVVDSVHFKFRGRELSGIGYIYVNRPERSFKLSVMTPVGIKLFDIVSTGGIARADFAIEKIRDMGDFTSVISEDINKIYFDTSVNTEDICAVKHEKIIFRKYHDGTVREYIFDKKNGALISKRYFINKKLICKITYADYRHDGTVFYPGEIYMKNYKYGYSLFTNLKEVKK